jgi:NAD-dependent dihydropyrimidine dehydrogenase PreA subunit
MKNLRYLEDVATVKLNAEKCVGCENCLNVCPHTVFAMADQKAEIIDNNGCMECGACANNCLGDAITVTPGVGCASYIIQTWIKGKENASCGC